MQATKAAEERQQPSQQEQARQSNGAEEAGKTQSSLNVSVPAGLPQTAGPVQQINGNITNSQVRQSTNQIPQIPMTFRVAAKEPQGTQRPATTTTGSSQRKRSRTTEEGVQSLMPVLTKLQEYTTLMNGYIENLQKNGQKSNTGLVRIQMSECMREILAETTSILARAVNTQDLQNGYLRLEKQMKDKIVCLQEENIAIKQQVVELQAKLLNKEQEDKVNMPPTYAQMANKGMINNIISGKQPPIPQIPTSVKHAPSECVILYKSEVKGEMKTKTEQEIFRREVRETLSMEEQQTLSAIRPTRYGGYTLIFYNERARDQAYKKLTQKEEERGVEEENSRLVAPIRRVAKIVCKDVPNDLSIEQIKRDMYGKHNPGLQSVNNEQRTGKIYRTRLGLIFELTSCEMIAIQSQGWKIRCDLGRELKVEEFISLQQCYACSKFGHSALECKAVEEVCRLCGKTGHAGKDCEHKNDKEKWKCANCSRMNQVKNMNLDTKHAAAQLHKCPVALQQKNIRKLQLASTGVFTTPIQKGDEQLNTRAIDTGVTRTATGHQDQGKFNNTRRNRSQSRRRRNNTFQQLPQRGSGILGYKGRNGKGEKAEEENPCVQRPTSLSQPLDHDGWQVVGRKQQIHDNNERGRGSLSQEGINSNAQMEVEEDNEPVEDNAQIDDDDE